MITAINLIVLEENQLTLKCFDSPLNSKSFDNSVGKLFPPKTIKFLDYVYSYGRAICIYNRMNNVVDPIERKELLFVALSFSTPRPIRPFVLLPMQLTFLLNLHLSSTVFMIAWYSAIRQWSSG